jgi:hypothetical protein
VGPPDAVDEMGRQGPVGNVRRPRESQEFAQRGRLGLEAMCEDRVAHALQSLDIGVIGRHVEERRLDQRQGADRLRIASSGDQGPERSVRVSQDVWAGREQRREVGRVDVEVVTPRGAWRVATPVCRHERPAHGQGSKRLPGRVGAGAAMDEEQLRATTLASHCDLRIHAACG